MHDMTCCCCMLGEVDLLSTFKTQNGEIISPFWIFSDYWSNNLKYLF